MSDWKKVEMSDNWAAQKPEDFIEGLLTAVEMEVGPNNSMLYTIEAKAITVEGKKENFSPPKELSVWGSTVLDGRMKKVKVGEEVKIVYKGKEKSDKRKGAEYKTWDVFHREADFDLVEAAKEEFEVE